MQSYGRYELLERLGRGGMAEVFLARMNGPMRVSRYVAIKRILPDFSTVAELNAMFLDEIRLAVHLSHPSIGSVHDFGVEGGCIFLAMELIEGQDVRALLHHALQGHPIPLECALYIAAQVARALDYAHNACDAQQRPLGIVHRDITPSNIIVSYRGDVKLVDFGIARAASHVRLHHTRAGELKGTIRYMSPEQAAGQDVDWRSDLFALTTVLLEMVIGHPAFKCDSDVQALKLVQQGRAPERDLYATLIPEDVGAIIDRGMQVDLAARFQSGETLALELERALRSRAPAFGPADLARMMEKVCSEALQQHRARMRGFAESGREEPADSTRRALAVAETHVAAAAADGEAPTRAGKATPTTPTPTTPAPTTPLPATPPPARETTTTEPMLSPSSRPLGRRNLLFIACAVAVSMLAVLGASQLRARNVVAPQSHATPSPPPQPLAPAAAPAAAPTNVAATAPIAPQKHAPERFGTLNLQSSPWASVTVDGKHVGQTPVVGLRLPAGGHRVTLTNPGLPPRTIRVVVPTNASVDRQVTLSD